MNVIKIGYSGSRNGMTKPQLIAVYQYLSYVLLVNDQDDPLIEAHHGDCTGGDAEFHVIATVLGCRTVMHPPDNTMFRAWCKADEVRAPEGYLSRDRDIVRETGELLTAPWSSVPDPGTWTATGYAVRMHRPVRIFMPADGTARAGSEFGAAWGVYQ